MKGFSKWLERAAMALLLGVLAFAGLTAKMIVDGQAELARSNAAFDQGDLRESILHARRAAVLYAPGAPHVSSAYARLGAIAAGAEASGDYALARQAWGAVRSAALETRHFVTPEADHLRAANENLARLAAEGSAPSADRGQMRAALVREDAPAAPWVAVLGLGFCLFFAGLGLLLRKESAGPTSSARRWIFAAMALLGVACWTLAVYRA